MAGNCLNSLPAVLSSQQNAGPLNPAVGRMPASNNLGFLGKATNKDPVRKVEIVYTVHVSTSYYYR